MIYIPQHISELLGNPMIKYYMVTKDHIAWKMFFVTQGVALCKNLSNKWVLKWFVGLICRTAHSKRQKAIRMSIGKVISRPCILLRSVQGSGLTLVWPVVKTLLCPCFSVFRATKYVAFSWILSNFYIMNIAIAKKSYIMYICSYVSTSYMATPSF